MDKAGPSGDYDGSSNTSLRESKTSTLIIDDVYDVNENCLKKLNNIRLGLNVPQFSEYRECLQNSFIDYGRSNVCTISGSESSPMSTIRRGSANNYFTSNTSFNLTKDFNQQKSPCSRPDTATTDNSSCDHYFISAQNPNFTIQSISSIDPELCLDLTESGPNSVSTSSNTGQSPLLKKAHLSCDDVQIEYELSSFELRKVSPMNNWSAAVGINHPEGSTPLSARCLEIPPKRMRIRLNTPRFSILQNNTSSATHTCHRKTSKVQENVSEFPNSVLKENYEFRGCLSAVDGLCETLASPQPRFCKSSQINKFAQPILFREESCTRYINTSRDKSISQICQEVQACINLEEESKKSLSCKSSTDTSNLKSIEEVELRSVSSQDLKSTISNRDSSSRSIETSYELSKSSKHALYLAKSHKTSSEKESFIIVHEVLPEHANSVTTVNGLIEDFNQDSDVCTNCKGSDNQYSISIHTSASRICSCNNLQNLKINIPSSVEDEEFVNIQQSSNLEPNITVIQKDKVRQHNMFRFWRFKRRKNRIGSGDSSANSDSLQSESQISQKSLQSYITSPVGIEMDNNFKPHINKNIEKPGKRPRKSLLDLDKRHRSRNSIDFEEKEINLINYSDLCVPIKSLDKLPDEGNVKDLLQSMSQSIFNKSEDQATKKVDSISDCSDVKEDLILHKFSDYSQFKTRAELLAEHVKETEIENETENVLSTVLKEATYPVLPSSSEDNSEVNCYLQRRKQQNTQLRFYEIPSPMNSTINLNQRDKENDDNHSPGKCRHNHDVKASDDTIVKIDNEDDDDDMPSGFCGNCFCKQILFPKKSRSYFL